MPTLYFCIVHCCVGQFGKVATPRSIDLQQTTLVANPRRLNPFYLNATPHAAVWTYLNAEVALPKGAVSRSSRHGSKQIGVDLNHFLHRPRCWQANNRNKESPL